VAEGDILYDANGQAVGRVGRESGAGMFVMDVPSTPASAPSRPAAAPGTVGETTVPPATTQEVQGIAEYTSAGDIQGGDTYVPFGPVIELERDPEGGGYLDPGYSTALTNEGFRRTFRIAGSVGLMPLLRFAHAAKAGMDTEDLEGMAALYTMIQDCVHPDDWAAFQEYATVTKAEDEDLMDFVGAAMEIISARPRKPRGSSSATSRRTSQRSKGNSSAPASVIPPGAIQPSEVDGLMPVADLVK
jgi:hypothetical protein